MLKKIPKEYFEGPQKLKLLWEEEWRGLGITQVCGIWHSMHRLEAHHFHVELGMGAL